MIKIWQRLGSAWRSSLSWDGGRWIAEAHAADGSDEVGFDRLSDALRWLGAPEAEAQVLAVFGALERGFLVWNGSVEDLQLQMGAMIREGVAL